MPRFAANLSMLFTEQPLIERVGAAARAGFEAVEVQFPYAEPAEAWKRELEAHRVPMVLHNLPAGDTARGERGIACHPGREAEFREGVERAVDYARTLGVPRLNCLSGIAPAGVPEAQLRRTFVANLRHAAARLAEAGIVLLVEPINRHDVPGFFLSGTAMALAILDEVGSPNLRIQYDIYHAQRTEGELAGTLSAQLARIGHIQVADNPGRHEPGTGEIACDFLFAHLDRIGWDGWIGAEYVPAAGTAEGLAWLRRWKRA
jgi:hydroxypyruvate isomerase